MKKIILLLLALNCFAGFSQTAYMQAFGQKTGKINDDLNGGSGIANSKGDMMPLESYSFEILSPRDPATGMPTGKRTHIPLTVVKKSGRSSTQFFNSLCTNENLSRVTIQIFKPNQNGQEELFETIELTNASLAYFKQNMDNTPAPGEAKGLIDTMRFTYQKISITYAKGGVTAEDNWSDRQ